MLRARCFFQPGFNREPSGKAESFKFARFIPQQCRNQHNGVELPGGGQHDIQPGRVLWILKDARPKANGRAEHIGLDGRE